MAQFGSPPSSMESQASLPPPSGGGATHTIYVAPDQHSLRYLPFAVNASVGDTLTYVWTTPINHTVTHSSALNICNKSSDAAQLNFVSGIKNAAAGIQTCQLHPFAFHTHYREAYISSLQSMSLSKAPILSSTTAASLITVNKACSVWSTHRAASGPPTPPSAR
jgi:plastocyanin